MKYNSLCVSFFEFYSVVQCVLRDNPLCTHSGTQLASEQHYSKNPVTVNSNNYIENFISIRLLMYKTNLRPFITF